MVYGNGAVTNYSYDPLTLRLSHLETQSSAGRVQDLNYQFDSVGNIRNITDYANTATQSFLYDDLDRLIQAQGGYGSFSYGYDSIGNMTSKEGVNLTYGKQGRLPHAVTQYGSTSIDYDANGNMLTKGNLALTYDTENRLSQVQDTSNNAPISASLTLEPGWNLISFAVLPQNKSISSVLAPIKGKFDQVSRYNSQTQALEHYVANSKYDQFTILDYNTGYQIYITSSTPVTLTVTGTYPESKTIPLKQEWNFIGANHRSQAVTDALKDIAFSSLLRYNKDTGSFDSYPAFTEIEPGQAYYLNIASSQDWVINNSAPVTTFTYDGDGGRVTKTERTTQDAGRTTLYVGSLFEKDSDGTQRKHIFAGVNRVCSLTQDAGRTTQDARYFHSDHLGSSNVITDSTGAQVGFTEFTPFGSTFRQTGAYDPKHKFTGKELDDSTGLYYYGARYYDPQLGRFISADTIVQAPYDPQSLNRYSYCRNNPINYIDPTGNVWWLAALIFIAKAAAVVSIGSALAGGISLAAGNQSLASTFFQISQISGYVSAAAGVASFIGSLTEAGKHAAMKVNPALLMNSADGSIPEINLERIVVTASRQTVTNAAWEASRGAVGAGIAGTASVMGSQITQAASFIIDTATISGQVINSAVNSVSAFITKKAIEGFSWCPRYGNWGGLDWSGGIQIRAGQIGPNVSAVDQMDGYFKEHDYCCYNALKVSASFERKLRLAGCDRTLYGELSSLPPNPNDWSPAAKDAEKAIDYRENADWWFGDVRGYRYR
jgi:RHS repeat-associated protein